LLIYPERETLITREGVWTQTSNLRPGKDPEIHRRWERSPKKRTRAVMFGS